METASLAKIKKELQGLSQENLINICTQLARYRKENKELIHYLLFLADDEQEYIRSVKEETRQSFRDMNSGSYYLVKKSVRRILKDLKKYIKYSGKKETELELLIFFCREVQGNTFFSEEYTVLMNLYRRQLNSIYKILNSLHEDFQEDFKEQIEYLSIPE